MSAGKCRPFCLDFNFENFRKHHPVLSTIYLSTVFFFVFTQINHLIYEKKNDYVTDMEL